MPGAKRKVIRLNNDKVISKVSKMKVLNKFKFLIKNNFVVLIFTIVGSSLLLSGFWITNATNTVNELKSPKFTQFVGLAVASWHSEPDVYFSLKAMNLSKNQSLGLSEPLNYFELDPKDRPLKFISLNNDYAVSSRPYLSSSGLLADVSRSILILLRAVGLSETVGIRLLYLTNMFMNIVFISFIISLIKYKIDKKIVRYSAYVLVINPWLLLDSTSLMFSPWIRFCGVFAILFYWKMAKAHLNDFKIFKYLIPGLVISTLNGFEFFFLQVAIILIFITIVFQPSKLLKIFLVWAMSSVLSTVIAFSLWLNTIFWNVRDLGKAIEILFFNLTKHSLARSTFVPEGAVASGDTSINQLAGLKSILFQQSIILPYPVPRYLLDLVNVDNLHFIFFLTSPFFFLSFLISTYRVYFFSPMVIAPITLWCLSAIGTNSYLYFHPHHMPPTSLFLVLALIILLAVKKESRENSINRRDAQQST
jgi:hypothetical protein